VISLQQEGSSVDIVSRYRLIAPRRELQVLLVRTGTLRDGGSCRVDTGKHLEEDPDAAFDVVVQLASAQQSHTIPVLRFIVSNVLPDLPRSDSNPIERFFSLMSSWRLTCTIAAAIDGFRIAEVPLPADILGQEISCFAVAGHKISLEHYTAVSAENGSVILLPEPYPEKIYVQIRNDLVQLEFGKGPRSDEVAAARWIQNLAPPEGDQILSGFEQSGAESPDEFSRFAASAAAPLPRTLRLDGESEIQLIECVQTDEAIYLFADIVGEKQIRAIALKGFRGSEEPLDFTSYQRWVSSDTSNTRSRDGRIRIVAFAKCKNEGQQAYRAFIRTDLRVTECWLKARRAESVEFHEFLGQFWPSAALDHEFMSAVAGPIARARAVKLRASSAISRIDIGGAGEAAVAGIEVQILSDGDVERLHRSLLAFAMAPLPVAFFRILLTRPEASEEVLRAVSWWADKHALSARIEIFPRDIPESVCVRALDSFGNRSAVLAVRAGAVPPRSDWHESIQSDILNAQFAAVGLLGVEYGQANGKKGELAATRMLQAFRNSELGVFAVPGAALARAELIDPELTTWEGAWVGWLLKFTATGGRLKFEPNMAFSDPMCSPPKAEFVQRSEELLLKIRVTHPITTHSRDQRVEVVLGDSSKTRSRTETPRRRPSREASSRMKTTGFVLS
jgi:hypothetical protein